MRNAEKYGKTEDAVKAYTEMLRRKGPMGVPAFFDWLEADYEPPRARPLADAAEAALVAFAPCVDSPHKGMVMAALREAVKAERERPKRNSGAYANAEDASTAFWRFCERHGMLKGGCNNCPINGERRGNVPCAIAWMFMGTEGGICEN